MTAKILPPSYTCVLLKFNVLFVTSGENFPIVNTPLAVIKKDIRVEVKKVDNIS